MMNIVMCVDWYKLTIVEYEVMKSSALKDIMLCNPLKSHDVSKEHVTSIFKVEK
jgi:hypothetical protein